VSAKAKRTVYQAMAFGTRDQKKSYYYWLRKIRKEAYEQMNASRCSDPCRYTYDRIIQFRFRSTDEAGNGYAPFIEKCIIKEKTFSQRGKK